MQLVEKLAIGPPMRPPNSPIIISIVTILSLFIKYTKSGFMEKEYSK